MLKVCEVTKHYAEAGSRSQICCAVDGISTEFRENTVYSLVGESGSGKSTLARILAFVEKPTGGDIEIDGKSVFAYGKRELRAKRVDIQLVMQDGLSSLDPRQKVEEILAEPLKDLMGMDKNQCAKRIRELARLVGLPEELLRQRPKTLSGGQQKRVCIARAISVNPRLIIFDESLSGLDVTLRKRIMDLLINLKEELKCSYLFITHDIEVAMYLSQVILVMKNGQIVERVENVQGYGDFSHSYSKSLINALMMKRSALQHISCGPAAQKSIC
ncbi:MAG: dipeptide/oligopeptide/nickel ABC transporter ATP-binding protein [Clostridiales bacterium]